MRKCICLLLIAVILAGCGAQTPAPEKVSARYEKETLIRLFEGGMDATGPDYMAVFLSKDIVYYEDRDTYESGRPYGEGEDWERHTFDEAQGHLVLNITAPGAYRISGEWSAGQIRVDLGEDAGDDPKAVVELILDGLDITCTVAPAIVFQNVYECDGERKKDNATPDADTADAGANLILVGDNSVTGSHVAKIFKDKKGEKKLWKQDGAIYSYMSMNVWGPGALVLNADNEGIGTERHLTVNGGDIIIRSGNDGINTKEDDVSVTTINGGSIHIAAGLGVEGDGIDSNGYLVINGGTVVISAHPASDLGLDSVLGTFIHGGTVVAMGATMEWTELTMGQVAMELQFGTPQPPDSAVKITTEDGTLIFAYDPGEDEILGENARPYQNMVISCPGFTPGDAYRIYADGTLICRADQQDPLFPISGGVNSFTAWIPAA